jgi:methyl-accepting chemotaxis protein
VEIALEQIVNAAREVAATVSQVSNASAHQNKSIAALDSTVCQLDGTTQQTAASAEESAAAAEQLTGLANTVRESVNALQAIIGDEPSEKRAHDPSDRPKEPFVKADPLPLRAKARGEFRSEFEN